MRRAASTDGMTTRLVLPWPPSLNHYWRRVGNRTLISRAGREYRHAVIGRAIAAKLPLIEGKLNVTIHAAPPDRRKRDLDNLLKAPLDALQHAGVIEDDGDIDDLRIIRSPKIAGGRLVIEIETR